MNKNPTPTRYVAGWNMPGYMPDSEPEDFEEFVDARRHVLWCIAQDSIEAETEEEADALDLFYKQVQVQTQEFSGRVGNRVYWVTTA